MPANGEEMVFGGAYAAGGAVATMLFEVWDLGTFGTAVIVLAAPSR